MIASILDLFIQSLDFVLFLTPIAIPLMLSYLAYHTFIDYNRQKYLNSLSWVMLEVIPSPENVKTPAAMELFLHALYQTSGETTWIDRWVLGKVRTWFSLELVSIEGKVKFYIWCEAKFKKLVESQIYAHYPGSEVAEVKEDYALRFNTKDFDMKITELALKKPDPYPIKTYIDYELDKPIDEEYKADPIASIIEFMSAVPEGNYACLQFIVRAHKAEDKDMSRLFPSFSKKVDNWKIVAKKEVEKIKKSSFMEFDEGDRKRKQNIQTELQKKIINALERSTTKFAFDTGIRVMYIGKNGLYDNKHGVLNGLLRQFNSDELNVFGTGSSTGFADYPWQDYFGTRKMRRKKEMLESYQARYYYWKKEWVPRLWFWDQKDYRKPMILNTEELATMYHFPGLVSQAPTLNRVDSRKVSPPDNLPM